MLHNNRWTVLAVALLLLLACLQLAGCGQDENAVDDTSKPASVVPIAGTDLNKVILTADAAKKLGIKTSPVSDQQMSGTLHKVVPYSALLYDTSGSTWVYTNPAPLTYIRAPVKVDVITGNQVFLTDGPPVKTMVVDVGVPELYGTEFGVGDEA